MLVQRFVLFGVFSVFVRVLFGGLLPLPENNLLKDTEIARAAKNEQRMLLTLDVELADLRKYPPGSHPGVILFRPLSLSPISVNAFITGFVRRTDLQKLTACVAVVDPVHMRVRYPLKAAE